MKDTCFKIFIMTMLGLLWLSLFYYGIKYIYKGIFRPEFRHEWNPLKISHSIMAGILEWLGSIFGPVVYRVFNLLLGLFSLSVSIFPLYLWWKAGMPPLGFK